MKRKRPLHRVIRRDGFIELWRPIGNTRRMLLVEQAVAQAKLELERLPPRSRGTKKRRPTLARS